MISIRSELPVFALVGTVPMLRTLETGSVYPIACGTKVGRNQRCSQVGPQSAGGDHVLEFTCSHREYSTHSGARHKDCPLRSTPSG